MTGFGRCTGGPRERGWAVRQKRSNSRRVHATPAPRRAIAGAPTSPLTQTSAGSRGPHRGGGARKPPGWLGSGSQIPSGSKCPIGNVRGSDRLCFEQGWFLIVECRRTHRFGPFPLNCQEMASTHVGINGKAAGWGSWALPLQLSHTSLVAVQPPSLLPSPLGFEK